MSANLNETKTGVRFAYNEVNGLPWHGLGTPANGVMTTAEAIVKAKLDYEVGITENHIMVNDIWVKADTRSTFYVNDENEVVVLGSGLGSVYDVFQNTEAFNFFDKIVGEKKAIVETAGALGKGETIFITAKLPDSVEITKSFVKKDVIDMYVVLTHSHDGTGAIKAFFTPVRVVCNNTLNAALKQAKNTISVRHTKTASGRLDAEASQVWGMVQKNIPIFTEAMQHLTKVKITDPKVLELLTQVFPGTVDENGEYSTRINNIRETVLEYYHEHDTQKNWVGTGYGFYNAVTGYLGNVKNFKDDSVKFKNLVDNVGVDFKSKQLAFDLAMAL